MSTSTRRSGRLGVRGQSGASSPVRTTSTGLDAPRREVLGRGCTPTDGAVENPLVLFICTGNYYRSRFAEALFNHHARRRGLRWRAFSRGGALFLPQGAISPHVVAGLARRGVALSETTPGPIGLTNADFEQAALCVALHEPEHRPVLRRRFPEWEAGVRYWRVPDLGEMDPEEVLPMIEAEVLALIDELEACGWKRRHEGLAPASQDGPPGGDLPQHPRGETRIGRPRGDASAR